ncbi:hypothetical protein BHM03_00020604 [Ensete ventricosum]|nr:hypothetical protein BHM03_00020604 [Ensete ventricosum]
MYVPQYQHMVYRYGSIHTIPMPVNTLTTRYQAVPSKIDRQRSIEEEKGKKRKEKKRRGEERIHHPRAVLTRLSSLPAGRLRAIAARGHGRFFSRASGKAPRPGTARYIPVRQLTGTQTGHYRAVPLKSAIGG